MTDQKGKVTKLPIHIPGLPPPWRAYQHKLKNNRVFFLNLKTRESLWDEDFSRYYSHIAKKIGSSKNWTQTTSNDNVNVDDDLSEPMEVDEIARELTSLRETNNCGWESQDQPSCLAMSDLASRVDEIWGLSGAPVMLAVFDTSALLNCSSILTDSIENQIPCVITFTVLRELDGLKNRPCESLRYRSSTIHRLMNEYVVTHPKLLAFESSIDAASKLHIQSFSGEVVEFPTLVADDRIIKTALSIRLRAFAAGGEATASLVHLISDDRNMRSKATAHEVQCMDTSEYMRTIREAYTSNNRTEASREVGSVTARGKSYAAVPPARRSAPPVSSTRSLGSQSQSARQSCAEQGESRTRHPAVTKGTSAQKSKIKSGVGSTKDKITKPSSQTMNAIVSKKLSAVIDEYKTRSCANSCQSSQSSVASTSNTSSSKPKAAKESPSNNNRGVRVKAVALSPKKPIPSRLQGITSSKRCESMEGFKPVLISQSQPSPSSADGSTTDEQQEQQLPMFAKQSDRLLYLLTKSVDAAVFALTEQRDRNESKEIYLDRMTTTAKRFLENDFQRVDLVTLVNLVESLYSECFQKLSAYQRVIRVDLLDEMCREGADCSVTRALRELVRHMTSLGWKPSPLAFDSSTEEHIGGVGGAASTTR